MSNRDLIKQFFNEYIDEKFKEKESLKNLFKNDDRKEKLFDNLSREILGVELNKRITFKREEFKKIVRDFTKMYCLACLRTKEKEVRSEHQAIIDKEIERQKAKQFEPELPEGAIEVERTSIANPFRK